jgi:hypothetical protein
MQGLGWNLGLGRPGSPVRAGRNCGSSRQFELSEREKVSRPTPFTTFVAFFFFFGFEETFICSLPVSFYFSFSYFIPSL